MIPDAAPFDLPLDQLRRRTSTKWRAAGPHVLPLWVAEMDVMPSPAAVESVTSAMRDGDTGYATGDGYAEAWADFARERWGTDDYSPSRSAVVPDVMLGVVEVLKLVTGPGDTVIVTPPVYPPFYAFAEHLGRSMVEVPLTPGRRLDLPALGAAFERRGGDERVAMLLCNPHNPTGTVHTAAELAQVAALAAETGVTVVVDEIHSPLVLPGAEFTPFLSVPGSGGAFALVSASKGWNLPGLKAALAFAGPDAARDLARLPEEVSHGPSHLAVLAHTAVLTEGRAWLDEVLTGLDRNRSLLRTLLDERLPQVDWSPGGATYLAWLDFAATPAAGEPEGAVRGDAGARAGVAAWLLERAQVLLSSGPAFGAGGSGCARLNFATSASVLAEAVERMAVALEAAG